jgi:hypothetical protein
MKKFICLMLMMLPIKTLAMGLLPKILIGAAAVGTTAYLIHEVSHHENHYQPPVVRKPATYTQMIAGTGTLDQNDSVSSWNQACANFTSSIQSQYPSRVISVSCGTPTVATSPNPRAVGIYADPLYTNSSTATYTVLI